MYYVDTLFKVGAWLLMISIPLGVWKMVDICVWIYEHVDIVVK